MIDCNSIYIYIYIYIYMYIYPQLDRRALHLSCADDLYFAICFGIYIYIYIYKWYINYHSMYKRTKYNEVSTYINRHYVLGPFNRAEPSILKIKFNNIRKIY